MSKVNNSNSKLKELCYCSECNYDLRKGTLLNKKPTETEIKYQHFIDLTIENGYNSIANYSFLFINGIQLLAKRLRSSKKNNSFRHCTLKHFNINLSIIDKNFSYWSLEERRETLFIIYMLLENYPNVISNIFESGSVMMTGIYGEKERIPYWLENLLIHKPINSNFYFPL